MNLYISDLHFGHKNVIQFDHRPFSDVEEMDKVLITRWNGRVAPDDDVYIVGDFAFHNEKPEEWYLEQLRGRKHLVIGNHDNRLLKNEKAMSYFETVDKMMHVADMGNQICLCHFPIADWNGMYRGSWHIYGHIHCSTTQAYQYMKTCERALNAGCMINNYTPASFQELVRNNRDWRTANVDHDTLLRDIMSANESEGACSLLTSDELDRDEITIYCKTEKMIVKEKGQERVKK